jgi:hypothetical protein
MPRFDAHDPAVDDWYGESDHPDLPLPPPGVKRGSGKGGLLSRLLGAGARVRSALKTARRDPEPRAILEAAQTLERDGGVVFANLEGWPRPPVVRGFVPDLYAVFEDREIVLEFENERSVLREEARRQDLAFAAWAEASPSRIYEQIVVEGGRGGRG